VSEASKENVEPENCNPGGKDRESREGFKKGPMGGRGGDGFNVQKKMNAGPRRTTDHPQKWTAEQRPLGSLTVEGLKTSEKASIDEGGGGKK